MSTVWRVIGIREDGTARWCDHDTERAAEMRATAWRERGWHVSVRKLNPERGAA